MSDRRPALGKGLSALIPDAPDIAGGAATTFEVDIDLLEPNDYQPRTHMDDERLQDLAQSIRANGMIQPIVVRRTDRRRDYQIIAGERRWRAAQTRRPRESAGGRQGGRAATKNSGGSRWRSSRTSSARISIPSKKRTPISKLVDEFGLRQERDRGAGRQGSIVGRQHAAAAAPARRSARRGRLGPALDGPRAGASSRCRATPISAASPATCSREISPCARPKRSSRRQSRPRRRAEARTAQQERCPHARGGRAAAARARHRGRDQAARQGRRRRDRVHQRGRTAADLRVPHRATKLNKRHAPRGT